MRPVCTYVCVWISISSPKNQNTCPDNVAGESERKWRDRLADAIEKETSEESEGRVIIEIAA